MVSNWDERLRPLLEALDLARHFSVVVVSCEVVYTKPDREIFLRAAAELGCDPGSVLHVGDREREDAGYGVISSLGELPAALGAAAAQSSSD